MKNEIELFGSMIRFNKIQISFEVQNLGDLKRVVFCDHCHCKYCDRPLDMNK